MAAIGAINVHSVTADDIKVEWLREDETEDTVVVAHVDIGPSLLAEISLFFADRGQAARFADRLAELIATLPDKAEPDTDVPAELDALSERTGIPADRLRQAYDTGGGE